MQRSIDMRGVEYIKPDKARFDLFADTLPAFRSVRTEALYRYWRSRRADGLPRRSDIDPSEIKSLLPYVLIVDIYRDPFRIFYRLVGTAVAHFSGLDFTGFFLDELSFDICTNEDLIKAYTAVCEKKQPGVGLAFTQLSHHSALDVEYIICPLVDAAGQVSQCLVLEDYVGKKGIELPRLRLARQA